MPTASVNGVDLFYDLAGDGPPLVLVHGSWGDGAGWDPVLPALAQHFRILTYDRRGHSRSERPPTQGSAEEDVADLSALMTQLELAPAHVAGISSGAALALRLAARRPDLVRSVAAHEPAFFALFADDPDEGPAMREALRRFEAATALLAAGNAEEGARQFAETVAYGPGAWEMIPPERRRVMVGNAPTWVDEMRDPGAWTADLAALAAIPCPILLTRGDQSPPFWSSCVAKLASVLPRAEVRVLRGAGHVPQASQPAAYAETVAVFAGAAGGATTGSPG